MNEEFIRIEHNANVTISPTEDTRIIVLVIGSTTGTITVNGAKKGEKIEVIGFVMGKGNDIVDVSLEVHHKADVTKSDIHVCSFALGSSDIFIKNTVHIDEQSVGSETQMHGRTLRMSDDTRIRYIPKFELDHENLTASHGVVVDGYEKESVRYLMSRGISEKDANVILAFGLFRSMAENVSAGTIRQTLYNEWKRFV
jgi:Fe-S cluster assembly protein SufD